MEESLSLTHPGALFRKAILLELLVNQKFMMLALRILSKIKLLSPGLAQCTELCLQLRGQADLRQVPNAKIALQHNLGLGGAVVVALYKMGFADANDK